MDMVMRSNRNKIVREALSVVISMGNLFLMLRGSRRIFFSWDSLRGILSGWTGQASTLFQDLYWNCSGANRCLAKGRNEFERPAGYGAGSAR